MTTDETQRDTLPLGALLALAMTGFICIVTETLPAGLLPQIGSGLGISPSLAGQMVTVYALGSLLAAIPLTIATQSWRRRTVLLLTIAGFLLFNSIHPAGRRWRWRHRRRCRSMRSPWPCVRRRRG